MYNKLNILDNVKWLDLSLIEIRKNLVEFSSPKMEFKNIFIWKYYSLVIKYFLEKMLQQPPNKHTSQIKNNKSRDFSFALVLHKLI